MFHWIVTKVLEQRVFSHFMNYFVDGVRQNSGYLAVYRPAFSDDFTDLHDRLLPVTLVTQLLILLISSCFFFLPFIVF
jgi:hypothetical protein